MSITNVLPALQEPIRMGAESHRKRTREVDQYSAFFESQIAWLAVTASKGRAYRPRQRRTSRTWQALVSQGTGGVLAILLNEGTVGLPEPAGRQHKPIASAL